MPVAWYIFLVVVVVPMMFVPVSQFFQMLVQEPRLLVAHCHAVTKRKPLGAPFMELQPVVSSICQVPGWISFRFGWIPALL
jgi:hypothetical protein